MAEFESQALKRLQEIQKKLIESTPELRSFKKIKAKYLDQSKESRPTTSNSAKKKKDTNVKTSELDQKIENLKKLIQSEKDKGEQMMHDMEAREERYLKREKEYRKTLIEYENELRARSNYNGSAQDQYNRNVRKIEGLHTVILDNVSQIQKKTSQILAEQEKDIRRQFNSKMKEVSKDLELEKKKKLEGVGNYAEKESQLTRELELMKTSMELIVSKNNELEEENYKIQKEFESQQLVRDVLFKEIVALKHENAALSEEIAKYKETAKETFTPQRSISNSIFPGKKPGTTSTYSIGRDMKADDPTRYEFIIQRLKRILDNERKNLKNVRNAYARELQNKTELEQILRQCVDEVKTEKTQDLPESKRKGIQLTPQDREKIVELMLSQERVLSLLYEKTLPSRAVTRERIYDSGDISGSSDQD
ncbi:hypothetical protein SteCoe_21230 [Stentor coeruleus]|uniref:Cilia- and flagella-associated protein 157 n=1 Tax=Stentor coeruleus TaxID=5963 RepID=A0A1R2BQ82_9CILI|nr:hypothetical protein SteCoe_21230 [Stentor coeruleus]